MNAKTAVSAPMPTVTPLVTVLQCRTSSDIDFTVLRALDHHHGYDAAAEVICSALEAIALQVGELNRLRDAGDLLRMIDTASEVSQIATRLELRGLFCAADHIVDCARVNDGVALSALTARLERMFDGTIARVWDYWES